EGEALEPESLHGRLIPADNIVELGGNSKVNHFGFADNLTKSWTGSFNAGFPDNAAQMNLIEHLFPD
ncbi:MAG: hypothetical protein IIT75_04030, partial [Candidatus Methanomethylophilus sp.]|nr:hypothetical protein [Methanomethylophilus sp.]